MKLFYMLDTNMVSYISSGRSLAARSRFLNLSSDEVACISSVTEAEIQYGLAKRPAATLLQQRMEWFLSSIQILPWGREAAKNYGQLRAKLESEGRTLGNMDMQIAAHCISAGAILVTNDRRLALADGLRSSVNWATDI